MCLKILSKKGAFCIRSQVYLGFCESFMMEFVAKLIGGYNTAQQMKFSIKDFFILFTVDWLMAITSLWFSILLILTLTGSLTYTIELIKPQNNCELDISLIVVYTGRYLAQIKNFNCFYNMQEILIGQLPIERAVLNICEDLKLSKETKFRLKQHLRQYGCLCVHFGYWVDFIL